jgi:hypothetical protein
MAKIQLKKIALVSHLKFVENQFLQVLVTNLSLRRRNNQDSKTKEGVELLVRFSDESPTISTRTAKRNVHEAIPAFQVKSRAYQEKLDDVLLYKKRRTYVHRDPNFPFRYASGGTLPIVRVCRKDYYCLFYRDIFPIGWNIANGACCTRDELLDPKRTAERELREELIMVDPFKGVQYIFQNGEDSVLSRFPGLSARQTWSKIFPALMSKQIKETKVPVKWLDGPDSIRIEIVGSDLSERDGCFLNVNAEDFGIEVDRIAKISLAESVVLCDGEQTGNWIVNRLVGLFEVRTMDEKLGSGDREFLPDRFFFNGVSYLGSRSLKKVVNQKLLPYLKDIRSPSEKREFVNCRYRYDLCPVTFRILKRYALQKNAAEARPGAKVFISYGGNDLDLARRVYDALKNTTEAFFFPTYSYSDTLTHTIDDALESAQCLIVVGSDIANINRDRCAYEWKSFCREIPLRKNKAIVIPFITGFNPDDLPRELRDYFVVQFKRDSFDISIFEELIPRIPRELRRAAAAAAAY